MYYICKPKTFIYNLFATNHLSVITMPADMTLNAGDKQVPSALFHYFPVSRITCLLLDGLAGVVLQCSAVYWPFDKIKRNLH